MFWNIFVACRVIILIGLFHHLLDILKNKFNPPRSVHLSKLEKSLGWKNAVEFVTKGPFSEVFDVHNFSKLES